MFSISFLKLIFYSLRRVVGFVGVSHKLNIPFNPRSPPKEHSTTIKMSAEAMNEWPDTHTQKPMDATKYIIYQSQFSLLSSRTLIAHKVGPNRNFFFFFPSGGVVPICRADSTVLVCSTER